MKIQQGGGTQADVKPADDSSNKNEANDIKKKEEDKANANANAQGAQALTAESEKQAQNPTEEQAQAPKKEEQAQAQKKETKVAEPKKEETQPSTEDKKEDKPASKEDKKEEKDPKETGKKEDQKDTKPEEKLEISEPIPVGQDRETSGAEAGNDISAQLEDLKVNLYANNEAKNGTKVTPLRGPIEANEGQDIGMDISFYVPKTVKKGDYFDIKLSDTVNGYGATSKDVAYKPKLYVGDDVVAEGSYDPTTNTFRYVFTEAAQKYGRFRQDINEVLYVDPKNVKNAKEGVEVSANLNGETKKKFDVDYSLELNDGDLEIPSNGAGTINELKENKDLGDKKGTYEQTYYVNYAGRKQNGTELTFENNDKAGDHGITTESEAIFDDDVLNSVKVYKVKDPSKLNGSFYVEDDNIEEVAPDQYKKELITTGNGLQNNGMKIKFNNAGSTDTYVVKYQGKYDPKKFVQIKSTMIANPNEAYSSAVHASTVSLKSAKSAPKADEGFFWENHIFQTLDDDGNVASTDFIHDFVNYAHGTPEEIYRTEKQDVAGYEIYKVENQDEAQADSLGNETTGHFVKGKRSKALYFYRKIQGSLTVWQDEEGNDVQQPEDGLKEKIEAPDGYKFVKSEPTETLKNGKKKNKHIYHKIVTRYVEEGPDAKELKEKVDGAHPDTAGTAVENYKKVDEKTDPKTGDVTNIYHKIITTWVDDKGKVLKGPEDGPKPDNDGVWDIPEYKLVGEPKVDPKTGDVTNIYKKIDVNYTSWVDDEGNRIKQPEKNLLEKGEDPDGYKFTGTTEEKDGDTTRRIHHYRRLKTRWVTDVDSEELKDEEYGSKKYEDFKADFEGYKFLKTKLRKDGDTVNIYHKIVTQWIDKDTLDPLKPKEDGAKPDDDGNDIANYKFVKKVVDPDNGNIINYYHQIKTRWVELGTGTELKNTEVGAHPDDDGKWDIDGYGLVSSDTNVETGDVTNIYQKLLPPYTIWVDEDGKQIKKLEEGLKDKGDAPDGYVFVKSSENEEIEGGKGYRNVHTYRKLVTKYVDEGGNEIPGNPPEVGTHDKKDIPGYEYVKKTGGGSDGDVSHVYRKKTKKTSYVDLNGQEIPNNPPEDGTHEKKEISGYTYDKTETDEDGNVKHFYKKVVVKTSYVDEDGGEIKDNPPVEGTQEKREISGYKFVETKNEENGDVTHVYKKISPKTSYIDDNGKEIDGHPTVDGKKEKDDIPGYSYQGEEDKDGNTIHKYHKIVTKYVDEDGKEIPNNPQEDGEKDPKDIPGYEHKETKVDEKTKDRTHVYKKKETPTPPTPQKPKTSYVDEKGNPIPNVPKEDGDQEHKEIPGYSFKDKEEGPDGNITYIYHKIVTKYVDEGGDPISDKPEEEGEKDKKDIPGYTFDKTEKDPTNGDIRHIYKKVTPKTSYVDEKGNPIPNVPKEDGDQEHKEIPGYSYKDKEEGPDGNITYIYHKIVTKYVDEGGDPISDKPEEEGEKDKKEIPGYTFDKTEKDPTNGDIRHIYKKVEKPSPCPDEPDEPSEPTPCPDEPSVPTPAPTPSIPSIPDQPSKPIENNTTIWVDENGNQLKDPKNGSVEKGKDPEGYEFVGTVKTKDGDTAHVYRKIAKEAGKVEEKETPKEKESPKEAPKSEANKKANKKEASANKNANPNVKTGVEALVSPLLALISAGAGLSLLKSKKEDEE